MALDSSSTEFAVFLSDRQDKHTFPIWIGPLEATAIALQLNNIQTHRPMTHDLIQNILTTFGSKVERIEVVDLKSRIFYALIHISTGEEIIAVDARPSDAIALALTTDAPIYVSDVVLSKAEKIGTDPDDWLGRLKPEDFKSRA